MKKLPLAIIFASLLGNTTVNAATIYNKDGNQMDIFGHISAMYTNSAGSKHIDGLKRKPSDKSGIGTTAYFGVAGRTKINDTVSGIAVSEWIMPAGTDSKSDGKIVTRAQYVGFDAAQYGILTFGRGDNAYYTVAGVTDIFTELDTNVNDHYALGDLHGSQIMYSISALGWDFRASYQAFSSKVNETPVNISNQAAFAFATRLSNGLSIAYGMSFYYLAKDAAGAMTRYYAPTNKIIHNLGDNTSFFTYGEYTPTFKVDRGISISYGTFGEGLYLALNATYTKYGSYSHQLISYEGVASYTLDNGLCFNLGYGTKRYNGDNIRSDLTLGIYYRLNANFKIFAEAAFDVNSKPGRFYGEQQIKNEAMGKNKAVIGLVYDF